MRLGPTVSEKLRALALATLTKAEPKIEAYLRSGLNPKPLNP